MALAVAAAATRTSLAGAAPPSEVHAIPAAAPRPPDVRTWAELERGASQFLGRRVRFIAQLRGEVEQWNAYRSRFGPVTHAAFQFWTDEQFLWLRDEYDAPPVRVFVRRGSEAAAQLARAPAYSRFMLEGTVRELFLSEPWIEVESAELLMERVTDADLIHASRGFELLQAGAWQLALPELDQAAAGNVPLHVEREIERLRALCRDALPKPRTRNGR